MDVLKSNSGLQVRLHLFKGMRKVGLYAAIAVLLIGCRYGAGDKQVIAGREVHKVVEYYSLFWGSPFHDGPANIHWAYTDSSGHEVKHGPNQNFYGNGRLQYESFYLDGKQDGTATSWNEKGEMTGQAFWRMGQDVGWANYDKGRLAYWNETIFEDDHKVAAKRFEQGIWTLEFNCGNKIDMQINPKTGELIRIPGATQVACQ